MRHWRIIWILLLLVSLVSGFAKVNGYGPVVGYQASPLTLNTRLYETLTWRSRLIDPSGYYYENGSDAYQAGDQFGYAAAGIGLQVGLILATEGIGELGAAGKAGETLEEAGGLEAGSEMEPVDSVVKENAEQTTSEIAEQKSTAPMEESLAVEGESTAGEVTEVENVAKGEPMLAEVPPVEDAVENGTAEISLENANAGSAESSMEGCFAAGTLVSTADGFREIQTIKVGDEVWSYNNVTEEWELKPVEATFIHQFSGDIVTVEMEGDSFTATGNHPIWVTAGENLENRPEASDLPKPVHNIGRDGRWVEARSLRVGDVLLSQSDQEVVVTGVASHGGTVPVYNMRVQRDHTYAVTRHAILVHNKCAQIDAWEGEGGNLGPAEEETVENNAVDLTLKYKEGWTDAQRAAADAKAAALTKADTVVTQSPPRSGTAQARYRQAVGLGSKGDADHIIDLQLGGADSILNMQSLDMSVNRSLGSQINQQIKKLPVGTRVNNVRMVDP